MNRSAPPGARSPPPPTRTGPTAATWPPTPPPQPPTPNSAHPGAGPRPTPTSPIPVIPGEEPQPVPPWQPLLALVQLPARIRRGRPLHLAIRAIIAAVLSLVVLQLIPGSPAAPADVLGLV